MSEQLKLSPEKQAEQLDASPEAKTNLERLHETAKAGEKAKPSVENLSRAAEQAALSGKEVSVGEQAEHSAQAPLGTQKDLKDQAYKQTMKSVRKHLPKRQRTMSRVIHQPVVQAVSEVTAKTVARPPSLLLGGLFALLGSSFLLYAARHYGFSYNFSVFILLFVGGYLIGLVCELIFSLLRRKT